VTDPRARAPVAVLGGGLAGVTAAAELRRRGIDVRVYEAGPRLAGLAASFQDKDGFSNDFGAHFVTNRLAAAIGVKDRCRTVRHYGEVFWVGGKGYSHPFGILRNPRFLMSAVSARLGHGENGTPIDSVATYFRRNYGRAFADSVLNPLVAAWSGAAADQLSPAVAIDKLQHGALYSVYLKLAGQMTRRAVANGYSHERPESPSVWHVYPDGGVGTLVERLAHDLNGSIALQSPVEAILVEDDRVVAIRVLGVEHPVSAVISTAPCNVLPRLVRGTTKLEFLARFRFRPMIFVNLRLRGRNLLPDTVLWTPEPHFPFFRLTDTTRSMPWLAPAGKSLVTVDLGCEVGDELWTMPEDRLIQLCLDHMPELVPDVRQRFLGASVLRTPIAYPVYLREYEADRLQFRRSTGVQGLHSIGRNGEFAHILMEDVYWRTLARVEHVVRELEVKH
jgi:protoporphyrinogen oxidase